MAFNKMFIMLPVMFAARKYDLNRPEVVTYIRMAYFPLHVVIVAIQVLMYLAAVAFAKTPAGKRMIFVPPPPQPFADPNETKKKYREVEYGTECVAQARKLLASTMMGMAFTSGLHFYKQVNVGMAVQTIMGPINLLEHALFKKFILKDGGRVLNEKLSKDELNDGDEIVDDQGNLLSTVSKSAATKKAIANKQEDLETRLLDTWDDGDKADLTVIMGSLSKANVNYKTKENKWTPLMVLSGLSCKGVVSSMRQLKGLGADVSITDAEGWNALHWSCFHGSESALGVLIDSSQFDVISLGLHMVKDNDGKTPLDLAQSENNLKIATLLSQAIQSSESKDVSKDDEPKKNK